MATTTTTCTPTTTTRMWPPALATLAKIPCMGANTWSTPFPALSPERQDSRCWWTKGRPSSCRASSIVWVRHENFIRDFSNMHISNWHTLLLCWATESHTRPQKNYIAECMSSSDTCSSNRCTSQANICHESTTNRLHFSQKMQVCLVSRLVQANMGGYKRSVYYRCRKSDAKGHAQAAVQVMTHNAAGWGKRKSHPCRQQQ